MRAVIPNIIIQLINGNTKVKLGNINTTRDFNFIKDTVSGFIAVMKNEESIGDVFNIGSNYEIKISDVLKIISSKMKLDIKVEIDKKRIRPKISEVERLWADNSRQLKAESNPEYSNLSGLKKALKKHYIGLAIQKIFVNTIIQGT